MVFADFYPTNNGDFETLREALEQVEMGGRGRVRFGRLSGGQKQRVLLARALVREAGLLLLDEPTRGIDIGAKEEIYRLMESLAESGMAILFVSSEMEEVISLSDRVLVMHEGSLTGQLSGDDINEESIMNLATGVRAVS